jgi:hypothetical protein
MTATRELAKITEVFFGVEPDHQSPLVSVRLEMTDGGVQSFQMCIGLEHHDSIKASILRAFQVPTVDDLVNLPCFVLRSFPYNGEPIEGLESFYGKRFTKHAWAREHKLPWAQLSIVSDRSEELMRDISRAERRIRELRMELQRLEHDYVDWEETP